MVAILAALAAPALASLMAIDLGGEYLKVAVVAPGRTPINIAMNEMSKRKTPVLVGVLEDRRVLGEDAVTAAARHPGRVIGALRDLLGRPADDTSIQELISLNSLPYTVVPDADRGTVVLSLDGGSQYSIEALVASELSYAQKIASAHVGAEIRDCVIVIPPYWGPAQRRALLDAAEIAEVSVLSLMHSHAAAALQYGIERDFTNRTESVLLYDVASRDVVAALVDFSSYSIRGSAKERSQFQVRDVAWREKAGANELDAALVRHFAKQFDAKHGTGVLADVRAATKLLRPVRRTKEMLSANSVAPFHVEELAGGHDFSASITRTEFEALAEGYWQDLQAPLTELVERNGLTADSNVTLQLLGGGSRVPRVRAELASVLAGLKLERQLDADEAFALGAGLYAANLSTTFRLRQFGMNDGNLFPVWIGIESAEGIPDHLATFLLDNGGEELMPFMRKLDTKRKVALSNVTADPLTFSLFYAGQRKPCCLRTDKVATYSLTGLAEAMDRYNQTGKTVIHFELTSSGLVELVKAESLIDFEETILVEKMVPDLEASDTETSVNSTGADGGAATHAADPSSSNSSDGASAPVEATTAMKRVSVPKQVKRSRVVNLRLSEMKTHGLQPMSADQKAATKAMLRDFAAREKAAREVAAARNELEAYIINTRSKLDDDELILRVTTEVARETFRSQLTEMEDWLYMDPEAETATADVLREKLQTLTAVGNPIKVKVYELQRRPERVDGARSLIEMVEKSTNTWPDARPWLNTTQIHELKNLGFSFKQWLEGVVARQESLADHEEPIFTVEQLQDRFEPVAKLFARLNAMPQPKPPPPPPSPTPTTADVPADGAHSPASDSGADAGTDADRDRKDELR